MHVVKRSFKYITTNQTEFNLFLSPASNLVNFSGKPALLMRQGLSETLGITVPVRFQLAPSMELTSYQATSIGFTVDFTLFIAETATSMIMSLCNSQPPGPLCVGFLSCIEAFWNDHLTSLYRCIISPKLSSTVSGADQSATALRRWCQHSVISTSLPINFKLELVYRYLFGLRRGASTPPRRHASVLPTFATPAVPSRWILMLVWLQKSKEHDYVFLVILSPGSSLRRIMLQTCV